MHDPPSRQTVNADQPAQVNSIVIGSDALDALERQLQASAQRFGNGLLSGPGKHRLVVGRCRGKRTFDGLGVDANRPMAADGADHQTVGVGHAEPHRAIVLHGAQVRLAKTIGAKAPCLGQDVKVARQALPQQSPRRDAQDLVLWPVVAVSLGHLIG